jgi:putative ABC transport system substrate-binding protein
MPLAAYAQQPAMPMVGFLFGLSARNLQIYMPPFIQGLKEAGYIDGQSVTIEARAADGQYDRLPGLVADLLERKAAAIYAAGGTEPAKVAKAATSTVPIVFGSAADPLKAGLVASLNRPGGNVTGISLIGSALEAKRLELLHQIVAGGAAIGALVNPNYPDANLQVQELEEAARVIGRPVDVVRASTDAQIDAAVAGLAEKGAGGLLVCQDVFFNSRRERLIGLAARHKLPAAYNQREYAELGGLVSYGTDFRDGYRQAGVYVGKILSGARPSDLPVLQPTKFELVINAKTARALALEIPPKLLFTADEVIE